MLKMLLIEGDAEIYGETEDYMICQYIDTLIARRFSITEDIYSKILPIFVETCNNLIDKNIDQVIKFTNFYMENKYFYIISEYHKNTTLLDILLNPDIETTFKRRYKILLDVIKIVEDLHAQNIILYELKSSNIIIDNDKVYIRNYGLSKFIQARNKKCKLSALPYMAPEVIKNDYMDKASDIYSIGILMWEIFSRSKIYPEYNSTKDLKVHIFNLGRPNISELDEHTPEEIIDLMKQCWSMRSSDRSNLQDIRKAISIKLDDLLN